MVTAKTDPARAVWVVQPNCSYERYYTYNQNINELVLLDDGYTVERIASLPTDIMVLSIGSGLSRGGDLSGAPNLQQVFLTSPTTSMKDLTFPETVTTLSIHRDLKANNVLLDMTGNAKLSDFGSSREVSIDETMTREVGTVAWIAPEVLRGDRYTEQADIYSLGVLLVELDRCSHPYAQQQVLTLDDTALSNPGGQPKNATNAVVKNTKIAILVSTGKLSPSPSTTCPAEVRQLVGRCLSFNAEDRPTAKEVHAILTQLQ